MTHKSEAEFSEKVKEQLGEFFGEENVYEEVYFAETRRFADFVVETPFFRFVIEVENDWDSALEGIGQAELYASHYEDAVPVVVLPEGHIEDPEYAMLQQRVLIIEI